MRLVDADELIEHAWRDKLDSRELIAEMIEKAPTIKEIPTNIPIDVFEKLIAQEPKKGHWIDTNSDDAYWYRCSRCNRRIDNRENYCPSCGAKMD